MPLHYSLHPNYLSKEPNQYRAVIKNQETFTREAIIERMIDRGSTISKSDVLAVLEEFGMVIKDIVANGGKIKDPLFASRTAIQGNFVLSEKYSSNKHTVKIHLTPGKDLQKAIQHLAVKKTKTSLPVPVLRTFKDLTTNTNDTILTPGGVGELKGYRLKIDSKAKNQGVFCITETGTAYKAKLIKSSAKHILFLIPDTLAETKITLEVRTKLQHVTALRTGKLHYTLSLATQQ